MENNESYIKCTLHQERDAVVNCPVCGKPICMECIEKFGIYENDERIGVCGECYLNILDNNIKTLVNEKRLLIANLIVSGLCMVGMLVYLLCTYESSNNIWKDILDFVLSIALAGSMFTFVVSFIKRVGSSVARSQGILGIIIAVLLSFIIEVVLSIFRTIVKFFTAYSKIKHYNASINSDTEAYYIAKEYLDKK